MDQGTKDLDQISQDLLQKAREVLNGNGKWQDTINELYVRGYEKEIYRLKLVPIETK
jgi:hypothetical protein